MSCRDSYGSLVMTLINLIPNMEDDKPHSEGLMPHFCAVSVSKDGNSHSLAGFHFNDTAILNSDCAKAIANYAKWQNTPMVHQRMHCILRTPPGN